MRLAVPTVLRIRCINSFLVSLVLVTLFSVATPPDLCAQAADQQDLPILEPGKPVKRKIGGGDYHHYRIALMSDEYLRLAVDQRGIDVRVKLYQPDGKVVAESNRFTGAYGPEMISWVTQPPGLYKLEIQSIERDQHADYYEVNLLEERVATFQDRNRLAPQTVFMQAEQLREQKTPKSLDQAIAKYEEALQLSRDVDDLAGEADTLNVLGLVYHVLKRDAVNARQRFEKALQIRQSLGDRRGEAETLNNIARVYESSGERQTALEYYERSLQPWQDAGDGYGQAWTLFNMGRVHYLSKAGQKALDYQNRALKLWRDLAEVSREAATLNSISDTYVSLNDYKSALSTYEQARQRWQVAGDLDGEAATLFSISNTYAVLHDTQKQNEFKSLAQEMMLKIAQARAVTPENKARLDKIHLAEQVQAEARSFLLQGTKDAQRKAIQKNEEAVQLFESINDYEREVSALFDISSIYRMLGEKENERKTLERSLSIARHVSSPSLQAETFQRFANLHSTYGDPLKAVDSYDRAIELWRNHGDRTSEAYVLSSAAKAYNDIGEKEKAVAYLERALKLYQTAGDRFREAYTLNDLAAIYARSETKLDYLKRTRNLRRDKGDRAGEAESLKEIIAVYLSLNDKRDALDYYHQALAMYQESKDGMGEAEILRDLMAYWKDLKQPRLAIFYGKQAVNTYQGVRRNIQGLDQQTQTSFLKSKEDIYRELADLLISEGRLPEAQQVLEMLKEEEFINFIRGRKKDPSVSDRSELTPKETELYKHYKELTERATVIGNEYDRLLAKKVRNDVDNNRLKELTAELQIANENFRNYLSQLSKALLNPDANDAVKTIQGYEGLKETLRELGAGSVALYTLVVKDKYRVILFTPSVRVAREYPIKAADLNRKIMALRLALQDPKSDPLPPAKELYQILIEPVVNDLKGADAKTLMWSLDGALRYVPIAALHDGEKYMVERYRNEIFTRSSVSRLAKDPVTPWRGLGFGVSNSSEGFEPLPAVVEELNSIFRDEDDPQTTKGTLPGRIMLNEKFTKDAMIAALQLQQYKLVHVASHFKLTPGDGTNSYLLLGKGDKLTVTQIDSLPDIFAGVDLLTLSACNTAIGGGGGNGEEIDSFGELAQRQGAKAVMASLWSVADLSTAILMRKFYEFRVRDSQPATNKAAALQEAQLAFLHKQVAPSEASDKDYTHPYYWAPFILIGNWR